MDQRDAVRGKVGSAGHGDGSLSQELRVVLVGRYQLGLGG